MFQGARAIVTRALVLQAGRQASTSSGNSRRMVYPYTWTAKISQFPYKFHYDNIWFFRYFILGYLASVYVYWRIQRLACSPASYKAWMARREKEAAEHAEHHH
ncbi:uncharacterized protein LOC111263624 [Varroa jacobsoni]|uniref:uncharacterized protein LOC111263624 n=1 Tax=Varroa jacobsoni TaxID=62625 RepID=UPI000BF2514B|nr:uncharacterized protein LOC111263624 [Varroa jacobsoni]